MSRHLVLLTLLLGACAGSPPPVSHQGRAATTATPRGEPWGQPVPSAEQEAAVRSFLEGLAEGRGAEVSGAAISIGPGLWGMLGDDPELSSHGMLLGLRVSLGGAQVVMVGRIFRGAEMAEVMTSPRFVELGDTFAGGEIRAATEAERHVAYLPISWEIAGKPVTVAHVDGATLVVHFDDAGGVMMLDVLEPIAQLMSGDTSGLVEQKP